MQFVDRFLKCADCGNDFVFTAGEQLFFSDKQFKNDPKRCKLCKAKRSGLGRSTNPNAATALPFSRTETRTECSACGVETTVPFKPTQGRPVLCRSCFQLMRVPAAVAAVASMDSPAAQVEAASATLDEALASRPEATPLPTHLPVPATGTSTMEMIAESPAAMLVEHETPAAQELQPVAEVGHA
jgi:CxxC-x17-CxxC domain-containing protein